MASVSYTHLLGEPIDGKGAIEAVGYNPIEKQAPGILERQSVDTPLHTGILSICLLYTSRCV